MNEQVMIYEVKSSANQNFNDLYSPDSQFYYWNNKHFKNLKKGDYVFVVNSHSNKVLFTRLDELSIDVKLDDGDTSFEDLGVKYKVSGQYREFVRLVLLEEFETPENWSYKSLGSGENTYLHGVNINVNLKANRIANISSLKEVCTGEEVEKILSLSETNFSKTSLYPQIVEAIDSDYIQELAKEETFRLQKGVDKLKEFDNFSKLKKDEIQSVYDDFEESDKTYSIYFQDLVIDSSEYELLRLIGQIVSYCDVNAFNKSELNDYADNRTIAKAGVRQTNWVKQLLQYKIEDLNLDVFTASTRSAIDYLKDPILGLTMLSDNHREMVSLNLLKDDSYKKETFVEALLSFFKPYNLQVVEERNRTAIYCGILYSFDEVKKLWFEHINGLVVCDNTGWIEHAVQDIAKSKSIVLWWDKSPTGGKKTVSLLKGNFEDEDAPYFYIYYTTNQIATHRSRIVDFSFEKDYKEKKWNKDGDTAWYQTIFSDYKEDNNGKEKKAKVAFLADSIEKLEHPIHTEEFRYFKKYHSPTRNNMQPFVEVISNNVNKRTEMDLVKSIKEIGKDQALQFYNKIDSLVDSLEIEKSDSRLIYNCTKNDKLSITIGQRYCLSYHLKNNKPWGFILPKNREIPDGIIKDFEFKSNGELDANYCLTNNLDLFNEYFKYVIESSKNELKKTEKTGHSRFNYQAFEDSIYDKTYRKEIFEKAFNTTKHTDMGIKLNTILYGPPGTGKTYNAVNYALNILGVDYSGLSRKKTLDKFNVLVNDGKIVFTTFHQSMSYEDFIEGIKPETVNGEVTYEIKPGVFKRLCSTKKYFKLNDSFGSRGQYKIVGLSNSMLQIERSSGLLDLSLNFVYELVESYLNGVIDDSYFEKDGREKLYEKLPTSWDKYLLGYDSMFREMLRYVSKRIDSDSLVSNDSEKKVIIIDEINRGNIANIFGELITLIEDDKRIGETNYSPVTLPYSGDLFGVPNNLYIIGTMNTADRSVEALDTALRRRFSFVEMDPKPYKLKEKEFICKGIELNRMLDAINARIEKLMDKDYCIGHSYFMKIENRDKPLDELRGIFKDNILPLMQEYFYGDWGKIMLVLGAEFVSVEVETIKFLAGNQNEDYDEFDEKPIYRFTDSENWDLNSFKSIYE